MAVIIPNVVNWSVTPQNGQEDYFTKMNIWLSESTNVIASLSTAITKINESNSESNDNLEEVLTARDQTVAARNEAVTAVATLTAGAIDNTTIALNKAFSNQFITNNYYKKTETYNKTEVDNKINVNGFTDKVTPINTDNFVLQETGGLFKKLSWANLKETLKSIFLTKPELITITGTATFDGTNQAIDMIGIGRLTLSIGDVIQITSPLNTRLHTVDSIPYESRILVNFEHRGPSTPAPKGRLINETATATITLFNRAKNAPLGQGQYWCVPASGRLNDTEYTNNTKRTIVVSVGSDYVSPYGTLVIDNISVFSTAVNTTGFDGTVIGDVSPDSKYKFTRFINAPILSELR